MIDTSDKPETLREARAEARVKMSKSTLDAVQQGRVPKGHVLEMARAAGILAAKKTAELIPLCHPIPLDVVAIDCSIEKEEIVITSGVKSVWKTGVEMEALTAVSVAALTIYDMVKPIDQAVVIEKISLLEKRGGKKDFLDKFKSPVRAAVLVISDSTFRGERQDRSGRIIQERLKEYPVVVEEYEILPDHEETISRELIRLSDELRLDMVFTTGGTGLGPKDVTCEATQKVIERPTPGISEAMRSFGQKRTPHAMLSRGEAGSRGKTLIINLPGSSKGAAESMDALLPGVFHSLKMLRGGGHDDPEK